MVAEVSARRVYLGFAAPALALKRAAAVFAVTGNDNRNLVVMTTPDERKSLEKTLAAA